MKLLVSDWLLFVSEERQLADNQRPLMVQLNWCKDDREGRFLLKKESDKTRLVSSRLTVSGEPLNVEVSRGRGVG